MATASGTILDQALMVTCDSGPLLGRHVTGLAVVGKLPYEDRGGPHVGDLAHSHSGVQAAIQNVAAHIGIRHPAVIGLREHGAARCRI
jgi:hypothetical protein